MTNNKLVEGKQLMCVWCNKELPKDKRFACNNKHLALAINKELDDASWEENEFLPLSTALIMGV